MMSKPAYLPSPLMPEAPRSKQHARNFSTGSVAVVFALAILAFSSRFSLDVAAIFSVSRTTENDLMQRVQYSAAATELWTIIRIFHSSDVV